MAFRVKGSSSAPAAPRKMTAIPQASQVGKQAPALANVGGAPKPTRSRRDYGKAAPAATSSPSPFGPTQGGF